MAFGFSIVLFFVALILIILIHEFGHYLTARAFRFRVLEYFVGFGPRLWSFRRGEIEYGVKAIPAGGYVKIAGMNPLENDVPPGDEDRAYYAKPLHQRALVILAGPMSHFLVAGLIFIGVFYFSGNPNRSQVKEVEKTLDGTPGPAYVAGIRPGDVILQVGNIQDPSSAQIGQYQHDHAGRPIRYVVERDGQQISMDVTPIEYTAHGQTVTRIGVLLTAPRDGIGPAIANGIHEVGSITVFSVEQIGHVFGPQGISQMFRALFTGAPRPQDGAQSVVGVSQQVGSFGSQGDWGTFFYIFAYVTLFIGLVNLIPLPPFDGGHLAVVLIEKIRGKQVDMRKLIPVSAVVLGFFVLFTTATVILDIWKPIQIAP
jgi:membrane-associated protease RseP (regulator of RpoE activity)